MIKKIIKFLRWLPHLIDIIDEILDILEKEGVIKSIENQRLTKKLKNDGRK